MPNFVTAILQDLPLPARLVPWPKAPPTTLVKCLALALLLHVWLVLLLGNAPAGTAQQGLGVWGAINVTLRGPVRDGVQAVQLPPAPAPANDRAGDAATPRWGGAVRVAEPLPATGPGAARLGETVPLPPALQPQTPQPPAPQTPALQTPVLQQPAPTAAVPTPVAPPTPGRVLQERAPPVPLPSATETAPVPATVPTPATAPAPAPAEAVPAPTAVIATPQLDRQLASPTLQTPASATVAPLPQVAAPPTLPTLAAPPTLANLPPAPPAPRQLQAPAQAEAPAAQAPLPRSSDLPPLPASAIHAIPTIPAIPTLPGTGLPTARSGAADAGAQVGHDVATPPAAAASATPRLNLQLARPRGGELSRMGSSGVLPLLPRPPERDDKLAREIEKAVKADCRNAYAGMGPLAVIPLALDAVRKDGGCKW